MNLFMMTLLAGLAVACGPQAGGPGREGPPMTSPRLAEASELSGVWRFTAPNGDVCRLTLSTDTTPLAAGSLAAPMHALDASECASLSAVRGWRPNPLGLDLTGADGLSLMTFERTAPDRLSDSRGRGDLSRG